MNDVAKTVLGGLLDPLSLLLGTGRLVFLMPLLPFHLHQKILPAPVVVFMKCNPHIRTRMNAAAPCDCFFSDRL